MKRRRILAMLVLAFGLMVSVIQVGQAAPMGTAWTYQGRLMDANVPGDGLYDFEFGLFSDPILSGSQVGDVVEVNDLEVIDGYFTVLLDFGEKAFTGDARWLEIGVRPGDSEERFIILSPRQEVTPTPYALYAKSAGNALTGSGTTNRIAKFTGTNTLGDSALYEHNYYVGVGTTNPRGMFDVDCDGGDIYLDTFSAQIYIGDVDGDGDETLFTVDDSAGKFVFENGNVGIGTTNPDKLLTLEKPGQGNSAPQLKVKGYYPGSSGGSYLVLGKSRGSDVGTNVTTQDADPLGLIDTFGINASNNEATATRIIFRQDGNAGSTFIPGRIEFLTSNGSAGASERMRINKDGNVGIGTTNPTYRLHINETDPSNNLWVAIDNDFRHTGLLLDCAANYDTSVLFREDGVNKFMIQNDGTTDYGLGIYEYGGPGFTTVWKNGNVGIGTTSPDHKLTVSTSETTGRAIYSEASASPGSGVVNYGGYFVSKGGRGKGVYGEASHTGDFQNEGGRFAACGRYGRGVYGNATGTDGRGVYGLASSSTGTNYGVYGSTYSSTGYAGYFNGRVHVTGNLSKGSGSFKIDHPLCPEEKYLQHSFVESPDMMNVYNGNAVLDENGEAVVKLPSYFEALNRDFRYQLTAIGAPAPNLYVAEEISDNSFKIAGGTGGMKVSWQVTGIRQDRYAQSHPIVVEEDKPVEVRGYYLHPELYGYGEEKSIEAARSSKVSKIRQVAKKVGK